MSTLTLFCFISLCIGFALGWYGRKRYRPSLSRASGGDLLLIARHWGIQPKSGESDAALRDRIDWVLRRPFSRMGGR